MKHTTKHLITALALCTGLSTTTSAEKLLFEKNYLNNGPSCEGQGIAQMPDGGFLISATRSMPLGGGSFQADISLIRTKANGDTLWTKTFGSPTQRELAEAMTLTPDGDVIIAGHIQPLGGGDFDAYLLCTDQQGIELWHKSIGVAGHDEFANGVKVLNDNILVCGTTYADTTQDGNAWLFKTDGTGNLMWQKNYGGTDYDDSWDLELTPEGGAMLTGGTYSFANGLYDDAWLIKTDTGGNMIWRRTFGLQDRVDWAWALTPVRSNGQVTGYAFTGVKDTEEDMPGAGFSSLHLVKVDTGGTLVWDKSITGPTGSFRKEGFDIVQLRNGDFAIAGSQFGTNNLQLYAIRTDANGNVLWDTSYAAGILAYRPQAITATADGGFAITGNVSSQTPSQYTFVANFGNGNLGVQAPGTTAGINVYPNPVQQTFTVRTKNEKISKLQLLNLNGQLLEEITVANKEQASITPTSRPSGIVLLKVHTDAGVHNSVLQFAP